MDASDIANICKHDPENDTPVGSTTPWYSSLRTHPFPDVVANRRTCGEKLQWNEESN